MVKSLFADVNFGMVKRQEPFCNVVKRSSSKNDDQNFLTPVLAVTTVHMPTPCTSVLFLSPDTHTHPHLRCTHDGCTAAYELLSSLRRHEKTHKGLYTIPNRPLQPLRLVATVAWSVKTLSDSCRVNWLAFVLVATQAIQKQGLENIMYTVCIMHAV